MANDTTAIRPESCRSDSETSQQETLTSAACWRKCIQLTLTAWTCATKKWFDCGQNDVHLQVFKCPISRAANFGNRRLMSALDSALRAVCLRSVRNVRKKSSKEEEGHEKAEPMISQRSQISGLRLRGYHVSQKEHRPRSINKSLQIPSSITCDHFGASQVKTLLLISRSTFPVAETMSMLANMQTTNLSSKGAFTTSRPMLPAQPRLPVRSSYKVVAMAKNPLQKTFKSKVYCCGFSHAAYFRCPECTGKHHV